MERKKKKKMKTKKRTIKKKEKEEMERKKNVVVCLHTKAVLLKTIVNALKKLVKISKIPFHGNLHRFLNNQCRINDVDSLFCSSAISDSTRLIVLIIKK